MLNLMTIFGILLTSFAAMATGGSKITQVKLDTPKMEIACQVMFDAVGSDEIIKLQQVKGTLNSFEGNGTFLDPRNANIKKKVMLSVDTISKWIAIGMKTKGLSISTEGVGSTRLNVINEKVPSDTFAIECKL